MDDFGLGLEDENSVDDGGVAVVLSPQAPKGDEGGDEGGSWHQGEQQQQQQQGQQQNQLEMVRQQKRQYVEWFSEFITSQSGIALPPAQGSMDAQHPDEQHVQVLEQLQPFVSLSVPQLVHSLYRATAAHLHLSALKYWADMVRELERAQRDVRDTGASLSQSMDAEAYANTMHRSIQALGAAYYAADSARYYTQQQQQPVDQQGAAVAADAGSTAAPLPVLIRAGEAIDARMQEFRHELYTRLTRDASMLLEACGWPPPLIGISGTSAAPLAQANGHADSLQPSSSLSSSDWQLAQQRQQHSEANGDPQHAQHGKAPPPSGFAGFAQDPSRLSQLLAVLTCLTALQQAVERAAFTGGTGGEGGALSPGMEASAADGVHGSGGKGATHQEMPLLWAATCLAAPLQAKLQMHFQPDTPAGRLDQPQWLFKLVIKLVKDHVLHMPALQPALEACGLGGRCHTTLEWPRAMREATKAVLRTARLPALVELWEDASTDATREEQACVLWSAHVDAMLSFDRELAPFLGAPVQVGAAPLPPTAAAASSWPLHQPPLPDALLPSGCLDAVCGELGFMQAWLAVLRHQVHAQLDQALQHPLAWQPHESWLEPGDDALAEGMPLADGMAAAATGIPLEFRPPRLADTVLQSVTRLVMLSAHAPTANHQRVLLDSVGGDLLTHVRELLRRRFDEAAQYHGLASEEGASLAGACMSAARYLHHTVSELLAGPWLHRLHQHHPPGTHLAPGASSARATPWPAGANGGVATPPPSTGSPLPPMLTPVKGLLGEVVVRHSFTPATWDPPAMAAAVTALGASHREMCLRVARELSLVFGRGAIKFREAVEAHAQFPTHQGASGTVSPQLLPALSALQAGMAALSRALDAPSFRDIWRAVAVPLNRFLFNHIATEARFSAAGAEQFSVDCASVVGLFAVYTRRPAAHFREVLAAVRLLTLPEGEVGEVVRRTSAASLAGQPLHRDTLLAQLGLGCLQPAQVVAVVERRL